MNLSCCTGVFPLSAVEFETLSAAVERLTLNDASVTVQRENSAALGAGFRCGYGQTWAIVLSKIPLCMAVLIH